MERYEFNGEDLRVNNINGDWVKYADHRREVEGLIKERDAYKAVLVGEEYENVERLGQQSIELCTVIGQTVATRTKELVQQVTQLTTELDEAKDELVDAEAELRLFRFFDAGKHLGATQRRVVVDSK